MRNRLNEIQIINRGDNSLRDCECIGVFDYLAGIPLDNKKPDVNQAVIFKLLVI